MFSVDKKFSGDNVIRKMASKYDDLSSIELSCSPVFL